MVDNWQIGGELIPKEPDEGAEHWVLIAELFEQIALICDRIERELRETTSIDDEEARKILDAATRFLKDGADV